jgi:hypothetical protein
MEGLRGYDVGDMDWTRTGEVSGGSQSGLKDGLIAVGYRHI